MLLYGGLIQSRISNDTTDEVLARWEKLKLLKNQNENLKIFASNVVMRIPSYDGDFEEPWYWAYYGEWIFKYSFYEDKFQQTGDKRTVFRNYISFYIIPEVDICKILKLMDCRNSYGH